jgi:glycosyltransferase involved in cell wall biosynthesis
MMRIAHIIKVTRISGAERHLLFLLEGLRKRGLDAHLIILVERDRPMDEMAAAAEQREIPQSRLIIHRDYDLTLLWRLRRTLRRIKPDIVHTHLVHADLFGYTAAKLARVAGVVTSRHLDDAFRYRSRWRRINRRLWRMIDGGIAISAAMRQFALDIEEAPADKVDIVRYGMEYKWLSDDDINSARQQLRAELSLPTDAQLLGMACRLVEQKGIPYALEALRRIRSDFPRAHLVIAGDGEKAGELRRLASKLGIADRVCWLGWRADAAELMAAFDIFLLPSLNEGFGLVLLEAMSRRVPIVASAVGAIPEIVVDGETGILVEARKVDQLAAAMARLLKDRALRKYMGLLGAARLEEHFNIETMVDGHIALYKKVLE